MSKLVWDRESEKLYETGVSGVALFVRGVNGYGTGVAWNGVSAFNLNPSGGDATKIYADNSNYLTMYSAEETGATLEAYTSPEEFDACDGCAEVAPGVKVKQQERKSFGLVVRTEIGNDTDGTDYGYKYHVLYGCKASPSSKGYTTINDSPEAMSLSWELTTTPIEVPGAKKSAAFEIDSTKVDATKLKAFEDIIYGTDPVEVEGEDPIPGTDPRLPMPEEIIRIFSNTQQPQG